MQIKLLKYKGQSNKIKKSFDVELTIDHVMLKDDTSIMNPEIIFASFNGGRLEDVASYNMMYVKQFKRYYYIDDIVALPGRNIKISAHVDPLKSFQDDILSTANMISRCSSTGKLNASIPDTELPIKSKKSYKCLAIKRACFTKKYILQTTGTGGGWLGQEV